MILNQDLQNNLFVCFEGLLINKIYYLEEVHDVDYILLLIGFTLLIKGADIFIDSSTIIAKKLNIPTLIIGFIMASFATSAPEASVSVIASLKGESSIAIGTIIGSNIFNILIVVGISGIIKNLYVGNSIIYKEFPFLIFSSIILFLLTFDGFFKDYSLNILSKFDGFFLLILFFIFIIYTIKSFKKLDYNVLLREYSIHSEFTFKETNTVLAKIFFKYPLLINIFLSILGISLIILGGQLVVNSAISIGEYFNISNKLIGLTIISIGTSLPEFITSIISVSKGEASIALGNIIGSNIFNMLFILGFCAFISPLNVDISLYSDYLLMIFGSVLTYLFSIKKRDINILESFILISMYVYYILNLLVNI